MREKPLGDDPRDAEPRRQRGERVLEDQLHPAAQRTQRAFVHRLKVAALEANRPLRWNEPKKRARQRRLARAGLADNPERAALSQVQVDAVERSPRRRACEQAPAAVFHGEPARGQEELASARAVGLSRENSASTNMRA